PHIAYAFTEAQVIAMVRAAYGDATLVTATTNLLAGENSRGGDPLTGDGDWVLNSQGNEGLLPAYWTQSQNVSSWTAPYTPSSLFHTVFGITQEPGLTLLGALNRTGTGQNALGREGVAALLNAANPNIRYFYTVAQVIDLVRAAYADPTVVDATTSMLL